MRLDWTLNPTNLLTAGVLICTLLWKFSAFIAKLEALLQAFQNHESKDDARFSAIDARFEAMRLRSDERFEDLKERIARRP